MKHRSKQILSVLLSLCMVLSLFAGTAVTVYAADEGPTTLYVNGQDMLNGGTVAGVNYDTATHTLTLENANLQTFHSGNIDSRYYESAAIIFADGGDLTIKLVGNDNKIIYADPDNKPNTVCGILLKNGNLTIEGSGTLTVQNKVNNPSNSINNFYDIECYGDISSLTIRNKATVKCEADNSAEQLKGMNLYGVYVGKGALTVDDSTLSVSTRKTNASACGICLNNEGFTHSLTGNAEVTVTADGQEANGIQVFLSVVKIGVGAKLRVSGANGAMPSYANGDVFAAADGAELTAKGSKTYNDNTLNEEITVGENGINAASLKTYKTIEVSAAAGGGTPTPGGDPTTPTAALDLKNISETNLQGATYANGIYTKSVKNGSWTWDPTNKILTLNNCDIKPMDESENPLEINGIEFPDGDVKLVLNGANFVSTPGKYAICGGDNLTLTISGSGSLDTLATNTHIKCENLVLKSGSVNLTFTYDSEIQGILATNLTVDGGTLNAVGFKRFAIYSNGGKIAINGGHVTISGGSGAIGGTRTDNISVAEKATIMGGDDADSKTIIPGIENKKYLEITVPAPAPATFADGFGSSVADADKYVKGETKNDKGYTFYGWVGSDGSIVDSAAEVNPGASYTARWTMNGKLVRTAPLDLSAQTEFLEDIAEGWSWNAEKKTLTLNGATFDVKLDTMEGLAAITLPDGATVTTVKGSKNVVNNSSVLDTGMGPYIGIGIAGDGNLTVAGEGELSVTGGELGLSSMGDLTINAPISVTATDTGEGNIYAIRAGSAEAPAKIIIASSLSINTPENGKIVTGFHGQYIAESDGDTAALRVVIGSAAQPGDSDKPAGKPAEKPAAPKTGDAGVALYIGIAAAAVLACGGVITVAHKRKEN